MMVTPWDFDVSSTGSTPLFRCNACYIKFPEEEALEDHILALHSSGNPHTEAENLNRCKTVVEVESPRPCELNPRPIDYTVNRGEIVNGDEVHIPKHSETTELEVPSKLPQNELSEEVPVLRPILTADKRFQCNLCDKLFTRKESLQYHFYSHTGEKPFACTHCGASFRAKPTLRNHIKVVHKNNLKSRYLKSDSTSDSETVACSFCSMRFKNQFGLKLHYCLAQHGHLKVNSSQHYNNASFESQYSTEKVNLGTTQFESDLKNNDLARSLYGRVLESNSELFDLPVTKLDSIKPVSKECLQSRDLYRESNSDYNINGSSVQHPRDLNTNELNGSSTLVPKTFQASSPNVRLKLATRKCHECPECEKKFTMRKNLITHITYTHNIGDMRYKCARCNKSFHYLCRLKLYMLKTHESGE